MVFGQTIATGSFCSSIVLSLLSDGRCSSYEQYCDPNRQFDPSPSPREFPNGTVIPPSEGPSVKTFIEDFGREDLLKYSTFIELPLF